MLGFLVRRLIAMVLTIWAVSFVAFAIIQLPPGDYLTSYVAQLSAAGDRIDPATIEALRQRYGLGQPFIVQYFKWIGGILQGDFGESFEWSAPVSELIWGRICSRGSVLFVKRTDPGGRDPTPIGIFL